MFLPFKPDVDIKVSRQVTSEMEYSAEIFEDPDDFREVEGILSEADFLVGMRLHSVILSARNHVPFVGLSYHPKCESVLQQLGTEEVMWCDSFDANKLTARVKKRYNSDDISETLEAEHQGLAAAAEKNIIQASVADEVPSYTDKFIYLAVSLVLIPLSIVHHRWEIYRGG